MKKFLVVLAVILVSLTAKSQIQFYERINESGSPEPNINIFGGKKIDSTNFRLTYFALVEEKWSEALISLAYSPAPWIELSIGGGVEHNPAIFRWTGSIYLEKGKFSLLAIWEKGDGSDNYWHKSLLLYKLSKTSSIGILNWRFHGLGPLFQKEIFKDTEIWAQPAYDLEFKVKRLIVGLNVKI